MANEKSRWAGSGVREKAGMLRMRHRRNMSRHQPARYGSVELN